MPLLCTREHHHRPRSGPGASTEAPVRRPEVSTTPRAPSEQEIASLAYSYWEARGRQHGSAVEDWLRAERELRERSAR